MSFSSSSRDLGISSRHSSRHHHQDDSHHHTSHSTASSSSTANYLPPSGKYKPYELKFKTNFEKPVILDNFEKRKWRQTYDDDWNFYWSSVGNIRKIFNPHSGIRLGDHQIINHFPNHYELTRKDLIVKNLKKYTKEMEKLGETVRVLDYVPLTYTLPVEYCLFEKKFTEAKQAGDSTWIMKPIARYGGAGISLVTKKSQVKEWMKERGRYCSTRDQHIISKYISNPFLIGGRKFDLRMYCLVTNYKPLKAYVYKHGFARFSAYTYTNDSRQLDDMRIHLTNTTLQKMAPAYNDTHGLKWSYQNLLQFLEHTRGKEAVDKMIEEIEYIFAHTLKSVSNVIYNDKHCFEMYGYDIMLDTNLKPWLIEVNASPSLATTTAADRVLKSCLMNDTFKIVLRKEFPDVPFYDYKVNISDRNIGDYKVLVNEESNQSGSGHGAGGSSRPPSKLRSRGMY